MVLGRSAGLTDEQMDRLLEDPLPQGLFTPAEEAIVVFARASARMEPITDSVWNALREHFDVKKIFEIIFVVGINQLVSRFHAAIQTDVDLDTLADVGAACRIAMPRPPQ